MICFDNMWTVCGQEPLPNNRARRKIDNKVVADG